MGTYSLTEDFRTSQHTDPMHPGRVVRDIIFKPNDSRLPDVPVCRVYTNRLDAIKILNGLNHEK